MRGDDLYSFIQGTFKWENRNHNQELQKDSILRRNKSNYGLYIIFLSEATPSNVFLLLYGVLTDVNIPPSHMVVATINRGLCIAGAVRVRD